MNLPDLNTWPPKDCPDWQAAAWYHARTKHHFHAYARAKGTMDWANQPDPFRRYEGAPLLSFPFPTQDTTPEYEAIYAPGSVEPKALTPQTLSDFFFYSLAVSAWKSYGETSWALRCNPSSGNLHPTEGYVILNKLDGFTEAAGVFHYRPDKHALEQRTLLKPEIYSDLSLEGDVPGFFVALTSIYWREAWKYGERAYRYCQHDIGHAAAALRLAAALYGWRMVVLPNVPDHLITQLLGLDRDDGYHSEEMEAPDLLAWIATDGKRIDPQLNRVNPEVIETIKIDQWTGCANQLSREHDQWQAIEIVHGNCILNKKDKTHDEYRAACDQYNNETRAVFEKPSNKLKAGHIIRARRSAQVMDGETSISREAFYTMLARTVPALTESPWDAQTWPILVHLGLFVHRVAGFEPGLYCLIRDPKQIEPVRKAFNRSEFVWTRPPGCAQELPLYLLMAGNAQQAAAQVSCGQDIAGLSAFSLSMIARFLPTLKEYGAHYYRRLFWETGLIGQTLYLDAEAFGVRATGIGCFFDDPVHQVFGLEGLDWQSLYHFTTGGAVTDQRLTTRPAYAELSKDMI